MQETGKILVNYRYFAPYAILHAGRFPLKNVYYTPYFIVSDLSGRLVVSQTLHAINNTLQDSTWIYDSDES